MKVTIGPIALFGTSADPPTFGHQALLKELSKLFPKVVTWASDNPMKNHFASLSQRHQLLQVLVQDLDIPHLELNQQLSSPQTIRTLEIAMRFWPQEELILIIGSDLTAQIPAWHQSEVLLQKARLGIAPREGWPLSTSDIKNLQSMGAKVDLLPLTIPASASSKIRSQLAVTEIPDAILPFILKDNLYGITNIK